MHLFVYELHFVVVASTRDDHILNGVEKEPPRYEVSYWDNFTTINDEVMTGTCLQAYRTEWSE